MSDYIKREDAVFIVLQQPMVSTSAVTEMRQLPGIDIVPCRECCRWMDGDGENGICRWNETNTRQMPAEGFCSYAKRRRRE